ncbi:MAG: thioredoxin-dependent thiol peroxidase [Chloroflexota bacterium]|nr:thioredoxin-dependent thiol peroxidase [Chloroflexota bacterium]
MAKIGESAPDFELLNQDNQPLRLSDLRGKKVIIFVYPKAGTPGCTEQACGFRDQFPTVSANNVVVLGLSADTPADQLKWKQAEKLPYDLLSDPDHAVMEEWGAWGQKTSFGKTSDGIIRSHYVIDEEGKFIDVQLNIKPKDSVEKAIKALG